MQSYDENNRLVQARILEEQSAVDQEVYNKLVGLDKAASKEKRVSRSIPEQIHDSMKQAESKGAVKHVIANMPNQGQEIEINGLKFKVSYVNNRRGDVHLKLQGVEEQPEQPVESQETVTL